MKTRITQRQAALHLKYYMFDWDDNILHMPTKIYLEKKTPKGWKPHAVSTAEFAHIRHDAKNYRPPNGDWNQAFIEFYDIGKRKDRAFLEDTKAALKPIIQGKEKGAPSFAKFKKALIEGRILAIITARSHSNASIRKGVEYFIKKVLTATEKKVMLHNLRLFVDYFGDAPRRLSDTQVLREYLDNNQYHGVTSPEFQKKVGIKLSGSESPEIAKQLAIRDFVHHVIGLVKHKGLGHPISVGFSDDDRRNVQAVEKFLKETLAREFPGVKFVVYDTSDPKHPKGRKIVIQGK